MAAEPNAVEQAVSRTLRDSLERIQRSSDELHQAVSDLVSACASSRPANALPPMIRAHTSAASLSAALEVLSRFVTSAMQLAPRSPLEQEISRATSLIAAELATSPMQPKPPPPHLTEQTPLEQTWTEPAPVEQPTLAAEIPLAPETSAAAEAPEAFEAPPVAEMPASEAVFSDAPPAGESASFSEPVPVYVYEPELAQEPMHVPEYAEQTQQESEPAEEEHIFSLDLLPPEEQELHRRAYRVAKVSMQDIKMLRPEDVRVGRENKDLCFRLRDDIEKAHKEYDRRFQSIQSHPVDYFYDWMVEILGGGDPQALGEYPYPSPVLRR
jgi:uncharacterized damage-inducible protein DinB